MSRACRLNTCMTFRGAGPSNRGCVGPTFMRSVLTCPVVMRSMAVVLLFLDGTVELTPDKQNFLKAPLRVKACSGPVLALACCRAHVC